ncbi:SfnB family sulfur acquisition oxidoreductase [Pseudomonas sp. PA15(2017)]|uniref:SfnB family sulfur acquisition oxidoreductase n=1 Tax=Pseudomonas sp. PA15(2017) TaxID=1932111 RepID=UPI0009658A21|nr:SfnB family sulfur acquisition oxidoreductase [Pseudomonas sp. PA15(2017)]OLU22226.1 SfnB family sulfur acquisition oxidoreductase [Pseudomonas sp. PA15(2017)]
MNAHTQPDVPLLRDDAQALAVADGLAERFAASAAERDRERQLPHAELAQFSHSGLWGISVPSAFGGPGLASVTVAKVIARIAQADGSLGQIPQNHFYALEVLRVNGSQAQQRRLYGEVLAGQRFGNALAELGTKTALDRTTRLTRTADGYRIDGRKFYCTGALFAQRIPTLAIDENGVGFLAFVPRHASGLQVIDDWSGFGQRTTGSGSVVFDGVAVATDDVLPFQSAFERPTTVGPFAQLLHAAIDTGIARGAYEDLLQFVRHKSRPWIDAGIEKASEDPLTQQEVGKLCVRLAATEALLERAGEFVDRAQAGPDADSVAAASIAVAEARAISTETSLLLGSKLLELAGSRATLAEHGLDRHWRNARTHTLHDPVRWKYHAVGDFYLNDRLPPRRGTI